MTSQEIKQLCDMFIPTDEPPVRLNVKSLSMNQKQKTLRSLVYSKDFLIESRIERKMKK